MSDQEIIKEKKKYNYSKEQVQIYNKTYKEKHQKEMLTCDVCFATYCFLNKSYHPHSIRHTLGIDLLESLSKPRANPETVGSDQGEECKGGIF